MHKSLKIGNLTIDSNVLLAPMTGVSDLPFRRLVKKFGCGLVISEMIASQAMIRQTKQSMRMITKDADEAPMAVQLAGCEPEIMAEAAKLNADLGAQMIDINMGCPVKKVVNGHAGSALMRNVKLAAAIMEATVKAVNLPVTLKMRMGWDENSKNAAALAKIAEDLGIQMITIHGRTRSQLYNGKANWPFIKTVKDAVSIPVIGNGDVVSCQDAKNLLEQSNADGVMIGRGSYGRPWFLNQVIHFLKNNSMINDPDENTKKQTMHSHLEDMLNFYGTETGIKIARKHLGWYSKGYRDGANYRVQINQTDCPKLMHDLINQLSE